jgi:hypothetical protein
MINLASRKYPLQKIAISIFGLYNLHAFANCKLKVFLSNIGQNEMTMLTFFLFYEEIKVPSYTCRLRATVFINKLAFIVVKHFMQN